MAQEAGFVHRLAFQTAILHATCRQCDEPLPATAASLSLPRPQRSGMATVRSLLPYLWPADDPGAKVRVVLAMGLLVLAKVATVYRAGHLWPHRRCAGAEGRRRAARRPAGAGHRATGCCGSAPPRSASCATRCSPRCSSARCAPPRCAPSDICTRSACASISTGRPARWRARSTAASQGIQSVLRLAVFNVVPTLIELLLVTAIIWHLFDWRFAAITFVAVVSYVGFTMSFAGWRVAHPPHDERHRQRRLHQGARQPAELRDGEVFRQRGARGGALRRRAGALRARRGARAGVAEHAEHRPGVHHRRRPDADHADGDARGARAAR